MKESTEAYAQYCGLTCWGGSEKRQDKPGFEAARNDTKRRMLRVSGLDKLLGEQDG